MTMRWIEQREARQMLATVYPERSAAPVRRPAFRHCVRVESTVRWLERCAGWLMLPAGPLLLRPQPVLVRRYATPRADASTTSIKPDRLPKGLRL